ncbi:hypothetical protein GIW81_02195 [Hyphomicrobium sp. xq]|uniref:Carboxypeptidase regulatory-like domain-containing protein n=1 Tax=Hyphomicrobium album TaxID=2665159 RepID=A0A6I3KK67_9HYPH|nr:hypothetical protein [Hyphomicrobium album]MTD93141.1 hypothetical protein [Hyphomicrobium album]
MAVAAPPEASPRLQISVVDAEGRPIAGALIDVYLDNEFVGTITSSGSSLLEFADPGVTLRLEARIADLKEIREIDARDHAVSFVFTNPPRRLTATIPGGRCADGTTGQPCVVCRVGGRQVRICG